METLQQAIQREIRDLGLTVETKALAPNVVRLTARRLADLTKLGHVVCLGPTSRVKGGWTTIVNKLAP